MKLPPGDADKRVDVAALVRANPLTNALLAQDLFARGVLTKKPLFSGRTGVSPKLSTPAGGPSGVHTQAGCWKVATPLCTATSSSSRRATAIRGTHWWRDNASGTLPWKKAETIGNDIADSPTFTATTYNRNFEMA